MWKQREEPSRSPSVPASPAQAPAAPPAAPVQTPSYAAQSQTPSYSSTPSGGDQTQKETESMHEEKASIGKSIVINGELSGSEDLTIEGRVDGKIELRDHVLTVGSNGRIKAQITAKAIVVLGQVTGNLNATEKVDIKETGSVEGDVVAPRVAIADGSHFKGSIDMQKKDHAEKGVFSKPESKSKTDSSPKTETSPVNGEFARV